MDNAQLVYLIVFSSLITLMLVMSFLFMVYIIFFRDSLSSPYEDESNCIPECMQYHDRYYQNEPLWNALNTIEKIRLKLMRKFFEFHRPQLVYVSFLSYDEVDATYLLIRDRGIRSFYFESYSDQLMDLVQDVEDQEEQAEIDGGANDEVTDTALGGQGELSPLLNSKAGLEAGLEAGAEAEALGITGTGTGGYATTDVLSTTYGGTDEATDYRRLKFTKVPFLVEDLTEVAFQTQEMSSCCLNMSLPYKNRKNDTIYFETKLYEFNPETTTIAIGLVTMPYPNFVLPGMAPYSVAIQTDGTVRLNNMPYINDDDLPVVLPQLLEGDVIGIGYRSIVGSVFVTHNGKTVLEVVKHLKVELRPCIGSVGGACKVSVNVGQMGFVYIEANVKKLGFCESQNEGVIGAPPSYFDLASGSDPVLDKGEELPPRYPDEEVSFFEGRYPPDYRSEKSVSITAKKHKRESRKRKKKRKARKAHDHKHENTNAVDGAIDGAAEGTTGSNGNGNGSC